MDPFLNTAQNQEETSVLKQCWTLYFDLCVPTGNEVIKEYIHVLVGILFSSWIKITYAV